MILQKIQKNLIEKPSGLGAFLGSNFQITLQTSSSRISPKRNRLEGGEIT